MALIFGRSEDCFGTSRKLASFGKVISPQVLLQSHFLMEDIDAMCSRPWQSIPLASLFLYLVTPIERSSSD